MEYNDLPKFRTAVGGFNRMDVVHYIESLAQAHQQALKQLQAENSELRRQLAQSAPSEPPAEAAPPEPPAAPPSQTLQEQELAAYRRAEAAERLACARAGQLQKAIDEIFTEAMRRFDSSSGEAGQLCQDLLCSYERLQTALSGIRSIYEQTSGSLQALLPQTKEAEAWQNTI